MIFMTIVVILSLPGVLCCSPGRGGIRRRGARKLTPLVYKQHVPNFSERSLAASGLPEGAVTRDDPEFRRLVPNYNPDILFKDEELTGADRIMTQRCKEKLNTLAISVMNQWPGVQLRVTEGWDEDNHHAQESLHYEGRAVDITTSDRDKRKYGMLARLAVESGFDWVFYESRSHIHASCKSEASNPSKNGGCFPGESLVMTSSGKRKPLSSVQIGDEILAVSSTGDFVFSPVILFLDRSPEEERKFHIIQTTGNTSLTLTPTHLVYVARDSDVKQVSFVDFEPIYAKDIQIGQLVLVHHKSSGALIAERVTKIRASVRRGVYAPLTSEGNLIVDGVLASCYAVVDSQTIAHAAFFPARLYNSIFGGQSEDVKSENGVHWYAQKLYSTASYLMSNHLEQE